MSRIEKALEKASQMRQQTTISAPVVSPDNETIDRTSSYSSVDEYPVQQESIIVTNPVLVSATDSDSPVAEEYRKLKSILLGMARKGSFANVIMITSAVAGEGKSVTSINLALSLAREMDHTVLLIDADMRKPSVDKYLGLETDAGLAEVLEERAVIADTLHHTGIGRLVVMPAGKATLNPVELFTSQRMTQFIQQIKHRYPDRFVIIDTPPILPFAETRTLSRLVDGVILVIKERLASHSSIAEAITALDGSTKLGVVYNEAEISVSDDRYGHYYSRYYGKKVESN